MADGVAEALARVPLFSEFPGDELDELAGLFRTQDYDAGATLTREGERGARVVAFFVIVEGEALVEVGGTQARKLVPGDYFGEIGLLRDVPRTATVTAETNLRCLALSAWAFRSLIQEHPILAQRLADAEARSEGSGAATSGT